MDKKQTVSRTVLGLFLFLGIHFVVCFYSSAVGVADALAFVRKRHNPLPALHGGAASVASLFPANQQFGYFAPQVCSEFRAQVHLGSSVTRKVSLVEFHLPPESALLMNSMNSATQDAGPATAIAASYASYALNLHRDYDYAFVTIEAEYLPPLRSATQSHSQWVAIHSYYFKR